MQHSDGLFASNIPKYYLYLALKGIGFGLFTATWVIYLQQARGMSLSQAALVDTIFFVTVSFGEVPTGIVADMLGRKRSMLIGALMMSLGIFGWAASPTMALVIASYICLGLGVTFISGAEDALFYESIKRSGREAEYTQLVGRAGVVMTGSFALSSAIGGLLAGVSLILPHLCAAAMMLLVAVMVTTMREPQSLEHADSKERKSFTETLFTALRLLKARPTLRYPILYLALVPLAPFLIETLLLQPHAVNLGAPIASLGLLVMGIQFVNMAGSSMSARIKQRVGEASVIYFVPMIVIASLLLLAAFQVLPALLLIAFMGFFNAALKPILLSRIQRQVSDDVRATVISMQSLVFTLGGAISQPSMAYIAEHQGIPAAYIFMAVGTLVIFSTLLWFGRRHFPNSTEQPAVVPAPVA